MVKLQKTKSRICPLPFSQLFIQSSGKVFPCSFLQNNIEVGDILSEPLQEIWSGDKMTNFRKKHLQGEVLACFENQEKFGCDKYIRRFENDTSVPKKPKRLDVMIDSFCNLKCIMCTNIYEARGGFERKEFWEESILEIFPFVEEIEVIGGEPFLCSDTYRLFKVVQEVNPKCRWVITTNGNFNVGKKIRDSIKDLNISVFAYSIDTLNKKSFDVIRVGGNYDLVMKSFFGFKEVFKEKLEKRDKFSFDINTVVQIENAFEVPDLVKFVRDQNCSHHLILLMHPFEFSILNQDENKIDKILKFYFSSLKESFDIEFFRLTLGLYKKSSANLKAKYAENLIELKSKIS